LTKLCQLGNNSSSNAISNRLRHSHLSASM
jgi:hypothetical protein